MPESIERRLSFNGGELSPWVESRVDLDKYRIGCRTLRNMVPKIYGTALKRWGTVYLGEVADSARKTRLVGFEFSATDTVMMEFGHQTLRFWSTGSGAGPVTVTGTAWADGTAYTAGQSVTNDGTTFICIADHTADDGGTGGSDDGAGDNEPGVGTDAGTYWHTLTGTTVELPTPYLETEVNELQFAQLNDLVYIAHADHAPMVLSRLSDTAWTLVELVPEWPAVREQNITTTTLTPSATTGDITLTASADLFDANMVGGYWLVTHRRELSTIEFSSFGKTSGYTTSALYCVGEWSFEAADIAPSTAWSVTVILERSYDKTNWETLRSFVSSERNPNHILSGTEIEPAWLRVRIEDVTGTITPRISVDVVDPNHYGIVKITGYTSATEVDAEVIWELNSTGATDKWSEGAWSDHRGFPRCLSIHQQRLFFGGNIAQPQTLWASVVDDFANFRTGADADLGMRLTLASDEGNVVQWMVSQRDLSIGTGGAEWVLKSGDTNRAITPENVLAERATSYGSAYLQARAVNDATIFAQRSGRRIRELSYAFERDGYVAPDMTLLAEHLLDAPAVAVAVQKTPETILWLVTSAGDLLGMTYERQQEVLCWHRHDSGDAIESVAVLPSSAEEDEIWFIVRRTVGGSTVRYVERWPLEQLETLKAGTTADLVMVDSALVWTGSAATTISGLDHLEGETVDVLSEGVWISGKQVSGGAITLDEATTKAIVGLPVTAELEPTYLATNDPGTVSRAGRWKMTRAVFDLWNSLGLEYSFDDGASWQRVPFRDMEAAMDTTPALFTGVWQVNLAGGGTNRLTGIKVRSADPFPLNLRAIYLRGDLNLER